MAPHKSPLTIIGEFMESAPVDIHGMANALGLKIVEEELPSNISGKITRKYPWDDEYFITISSSHSETRKRFTIAHEIAHFVFHRSMIGDGIFDNELYRGSLSNAVERQANQYAANFLMPQDLMRRAWSEGIQTPEALARHFKVSPAVAEIRISELGCHKWD